MNHRILTIPVTLVALFFSIYLPSAYSDCPGWVYNGDYSRPQQFPFMAAIVKRGADRKGYAVCGGSLVHPRWVLTASHCYPKGADEDYFAFLGSVDLTSSKAALVPVIGGIRAADASGLNAMLKGADAVLLELKHPVIVEGVASVRIATSKEEKRYKQRQLMISGWGETETGEYPANLKHADVGGISNNYCTSVYGKSFVPQTMLCAGRLSSAPGVQNGVDTCSGDSGGPLFASRRGAHTLLGITSWGVYPCADHERPGVYTRVAPLRDWILKTVFSREEITAEVNVFLQQIDDYLNYFDPNYVNNLLEGIGNPNLDFSTLQNELITGSQCTIGKQVRILKGYAATDRPGRKTLKRFSEKGLKKLTRMLSRMVKKKDKLSFVRRAGKKIKKQISRMTS